MTWQGGEPRQRVVSFGTATPVSPKNECVGSPEFFNGSWYLFCSEDGSMTWPKARGICEAAGGFLVSIESAAEDEYLDSRPAFTGSVWIGANDLQREGEWYFANQSGLQGGLHFWSGDQRGSPVAGAFQDWRRDEPTPGDTNEAIDCAFIHKPTARWSASRCDYERDFLCEWRGHQGQSLNRGVSFSPMDESGLPALSLRLGTSAIVVRGAQAFPKDAQTHVALVLDPQAGEVALYLNGLRVASAMASGSLADLHDVDNWIGRSHVQQDPGFSGSIAELRIYGRALTADELATSRSAGTDPRFLE